MIRWLIRFHSPIKFIIHYTKTFFLCNFCLYMTNLYQIKWRLKPVPLVVFNFFLLSQTPSTRFSGPDLRSRRRKIDKMKTVPGMGRGGRSHRRFTPVNMDRGFLQDSYFILLHRVTSDVRYVNYWVVHNLKCKLLSKVVRVCVSGSLKPTPGLLENSVWRRWFDPVDQRVLTDSTTRQVLVTFLFVWLIVHYFPCPDFLCY